MGKSYASRETAVLAAADTPVVVDTLGHVAAVPITVPAGRSRITKIIGAFAADGVAAGAAVIWITLSGNGVKDGEQTIMLGGIGGELVTSDIQAQASLAVEVEIDILAGNQINIEAEKNVDVGDASVGVTLEMS